MMVKMDRNGPLLGTSAATRRVRELCAALGPRRCTVAVTGETGVGKGLVARLLHALSGRTGEFVRVAAAQLDPGMFRSQFNGHVAGAFSGALRDHRGLLEEADGGTLFLDELQDFTPEVQGVLLDVLDGEAIRPLGAEREIGPDVRVVVAAQEPLDDLVARKRLRPDLRQRLGWVGIRIPPLRERLEDLRELVPHFARRAAVAEHLPVPSCTPELFDALSRFTWPGNVRQLAAAVEHVVLFSAGPCAGPEALPALLLSGSPGPDGSARVWGRDTIGALRRAGGNVALAARLLSVSPKTVRRDLNKRGVRAEDIRASVVTR